MLNPTSIATAIVTISAAVAYRQWRKYHVVDNTEEIFKGQYDCNSVIKSFNAPMAKRVGNRSLYHFTSLENINLPKVVYIGAQAFEGCTALKNINLPQATSIKVLAFEGCTALEYIDLPEVTTTGDAAFRNCRSLEYINLPKAKFIANCTLENCTALKYINLLEATSINGEACRGCIALKNINLPKATIIEGLAFEGCTALEYIDLPEVTTIGNGAFLNCTSLEYIDLPKVTEVGPNAFRQCTNLKVAYIPYATRIGDDIFSGCNNLSTVVLPDSFFNKTPEVQAAEKIRMGIREEAQCVRYSDYIKSSAKEINDVIGEKRFKENHREKDNDNISRLLLFKRMRDGLDPRGLSEDKKKTLESKNSGSDVYKVVKSIDDYEHKKEWAKYLGVEVDTAEVKQPQQDAGEDEVDESVKKIREQLNALNSYYEIDSKLYEIDSKLDEKINEYDRPINVFLNMSDINSMKSTSKEGNRLPFGFSGTTTRSTRYSVRKEKLNGYRKQLNEWKTKKGPEDELQDIADSVESLFEEMKRTSTRSTKPGMQ